MKRFTFLTLALILVSVFLMGCKGEDGEMGAAGPAGRDGTNPPLPPVITAVVAAPDSIGMGQTTTLFVAAYDPNGDDMTYTWSASAGTLNRTDRASVEWTGPREMGITFVTVTVADAGSSSTDSVAVGVDTYVPEVFPSFMGDNANRCAHCHGDLVESWHTTGHSEAWQTLVDDNVTTNPYCVQCHVTGYDTRVNFDGSIAQEGIDNGGFDDFATASLHGVQCEACHGPVGPNFSDHEPTTWTALTGESCARCHTQNAEWATSGHGTLLQREDREAVFAEWGRSSCDYCHISQAFINKYNPDSPALPVTAETADQVGCATCHDPHGTPNDGNLRVVDSVWTPYGGPEMPAGYAIEGLENGQLCAHCHHARRDANNVNGQINNGSSRPGPHESPQADMVMGRGSYEIADLTYEREHAHQNIPNGCVACHMYQIPFGQPGGPITGHSFAPDVRTCQGCHPGLQDFNFNNGQTEIEELMVELTALLPRDSVGNVRSAMDTVNWTRPQREAGYAYFFVHADASHGVHNPEYARSLLENAIDLLTVQAARREEGFVRN